MGKKIFGIYLAKLDAPNSEAHARLELPASPLELNDAMDKVQLQENEELYLEIDDYYGFEYLAPHLMELDVSLNELNDLAGRLAVLDETEQEAFDGLLRLKIQRNVESNGGILTMQDLRNLAVSAGADCCHVVGAPRLRAILEKRIGPQQHVSADGKFSWLEVECLGACCNGPMVQINNDYYEDLTDENFEKLLDDLAAGRPVKKGSQTGRVSSEPAGGAITTLTEFYGADGTSGPLSGKK